MSACDAGCGAGCGVKFAALVDENLQREPDHQVGEVDLGSLLQFPLDWPRLVRAVLANPSPSLAKLLLNR